MHRGHIELLQYAKSLGDILFVGIDSDIKVNKDKGISRPFNKEEDRKYFLESIKFVDHVLIFNTSEELEKLIKQVSPDFLVVGSDWKEKEIVGKEFAKKVEYFGRIAGYSTTNILGEKND